MNLKPLATMVALLFFSAALAQENGISWSSLSDDQQEILSRLEQTWDTLPAERQARLSKGAARWAGMSRQQRSEARERFRTWRKLPAERREQIRERAQIFQDLPRAERIRKCIGDTQEIVGALNDEMGLQAVDPILCAVTDPDNPVAATSPSNRHRILS